MRKLAMIPAYNEAGNIVTTVNDILTNAPGFDYVIINDHSKDETLAICKEHGFHVIDLPVNLGIGGGVQTGYMYARDHGYDLAVQFDGDGQHNASYLNEMAERMESDNLDMLIGSRYITKEGFQSSGLRRMGIRYFTGLIRLLSGKKITDPTSGMRMVNARVIRQFAENYPKDYPEPESVVTLIRQGARVEEMPVVMNERREGVSSISPLKAIYYMIKVSLAVVIAAL